MKKLIMAFVIGLALSGCAHRKWVMKSCQQAQGTDFWVCERQ